MKEFRKRIWIDPFQTGLLIRIGVYCLVYQVVWWAFFAFCEQINVAFAGIGAKGSFLENGPLRGLLALLILVPPLTLDALRFAHRLVGPLYRFRRTMQAVAAGEPVSLVALRKGDMLVDFKDDFNAMLKHLEQQGYVLLKPAKPAVDATPPQTVDGRTMHPAHPGGARPRRSEGSQHPAGDPELTCSP